MTAMMRWVVARAAVSFCTSDDYIFIAAVAVVAVVGSWISGVNMASIITLIMEVLTTTAASTTRASINLTSCPFVVVVIVIPSSLRIIALDEFVLRFFSLKDDRLSRSILDNDWLGLLAYDDGLWLVVLGGASVPLQIPLVVTRWLALYFSFITKLADSVRRWRCALNISFVANDLSWSVSSAVLVAVISGRLFAFTLDDDLFLVGIFFLECSVWYSVAANGRVSTRFVAVFVYDRHDDGAGPVTAVWYWPLRSADDKTGGADGRGGEFVGKRFGQRL
jgi:hypothetical protein